MFPCPLLTHISLHQHPNNKRVPTFYFEVPYAWARMVILEGKGRKRHVLPCPCFRDDFQPSWVSGKEIHGQTWGCFLLLHLHFHIIPLSPFPGKGSPLPSHPPGTVLPLRPPTSPCAPRSSADPPGLPFPPLQPYFFPPCQGAQSSRVSEARSPGRMRSVELGVVFGSEKAKLPSAGALICRQSQTV